MKSRYLPWARVFLCTFTALIFSGYPAAATAATRVVHGPFSDPLCVPFTDVTINDAIGNANVGDTILVCAGVYPENVMVDKSVILRGAKAGVSGRLRPNASTDFATESNVAGSFTIQAPGVVLDGFTVTLASALGAMPLNPVAITVKVIGSRAVITNNVVDQVAVANNGNPITGNAIGVYLERGPDNVRITRNRIQNLTSNLSTQGVLVGDSISTDPSLNILISDNIFDNIQSLKGAYGVQVNNRANATVTVRNNTIQRLRGAGWAHAIGLEGPTPDAEVTTNDIEDVVGPALPDSSQNAISVFFEDNPYFPSAQTHLNNFIVTKMVAYGIALHPDLIASDGSRGSVPGTCNYWNAADGPGRVGPGSGALVTTNVRFDPWLTMAVDFTGPAPHAPPCNNNNECIGDDDDDHDHDGKRDDVDADDDNDGKSDLNDDDDDNDGKWDNDDDDDDNDCIKDEDDDKSTRQHQRCKDGNLNGGGYNDSVIAGGDSGLPLIVRIESPNAQFLKIEIYDPAGRLLSVSLPTPGKIFAVAPANILGLYTVRVRNAGIAPITYTSKIITSTLW